MATDTQLSFDQTVPCGFAHRRALGEVFVADSAQVGPDEFLLAIQIPRAHSLWYDRLVTYHDPFSTAEAARQSAFVVVHRYLGVAQGAPFTLRSLRLQIGDIEAYADDERSPLEGVLRMRLESQQRSAVEMGGMSFEGDLEIRGLHAITVAGDIVFLPRGDYEALRAFQRRRKLQGGDGTAERVTPLAPELIGRRDTRNVAIGAPTPGAEGEVRYPLVIDQRHPSFFDHAYDHVPGPLMVEAWRQAALVTATSSGALESPVAAVSACEAAFSDFAEFDAPVECSTRLEEAAPPGCAAVTLGLHQLGKQIAEGRIELCPYPAGADVDD